MKFAKIYICSKHMLKCKLKHESTLIQNKCICNREFQHKRSLVRHQKDCQPHKDNVINNRGDNVQGVQVAGNHNEIVNHSYNTTVNNNQQININPVGEEDFSHITKEDIKRILGAGNGAFKELLMAVYSLPANNNLFFVNRRENKMKYMKSRECVDIDNSVKILNKLIGLYEDKLDDYITEYCESDNQADTYLGILLQQLSDAHAEGIYDDKNMESMVNMVMLVGSTAKRQLLKKELEIAQLREQLASARAAGFCP